jgi:Cdc25 family phosphatase
MQFFHEWKRICNKLIYSKPVFESAKVVPLENAFALKKNCLVFRHLYDSSFCYVNKQHLLIFPYENAADHNNKMLNAPTITPRQLIRRLLTPNSSLSLESPKKLMIIDVRDEDFAGGNITGAVNIPSHTFQSQVSDLIAKTCDGKHELVFHCMMSQVRGPRCCRLFLEELVDQVENLELYPDVYLLEGFSEFFNSVPESQKSALLEGFSSSSYLRN